LALEEGGGGGGDDDEEEEEQKRIIHQNYSESHLQGKHRLDP